MRRDRPTMPEQPGWACGLGSSGSLHLGATARYAFRLLPLSGAIRSSLTPTGACAGGASRPRSRSRLACASWWSFSTPCSASRPRGGTPDATWVRVRRSGCALRCALRVRVVRAVRMVAEAVERVVERDRVVAGGRREAQQAAQAPSRRVVGAGGIAGKADAADGVRAAVQA